LNSNNGTYVNNNRIESHQLKDGDVITIGKHELVFLVKGEAVLTDGLGNQPDVEDYSSEMEGTILTVGSMQKKAQAQAQAAAPKPQPAKPQFVGSLTVMEGDLPQNRYDLTSSATNIGKGDSAEIRLSGFFTPSVSMVVHRGDDGFYVSPMGGFFKPKLNGETITGKTKLKSGDVLSIRSYKFQYTQK
ncbi:MAG: FHA domain-containing protein, partial [Magnetococcales bacterium]|nr:FHA domain-containing protein [Magnetococcales bacterium]